MRKKYIKYKTILVIDWMDSTYYSGWHGKETAEKFINDESYKRQKTCGYFVSEDKDKIIVCLSFGDDNAADIMLIPKKCVLAIKRIRN